MVKIVLKIAVLLLVFVSCNKSEYDNTNLLGKAQVEYIKNDSKNVKTIKIKFDEPQVLKSEYLFIKYDRSFKLKTNSIPDTIEFDRVKVPHLPYTEVKLMPQEKHDFKLLYFDSLSFTEITMELAHPRRKKNTHLRAISIVNEKEFNDLFSKFPTFKSSDIPVIKVDVDNALTKKHQPGIVHVYNNSSGKNKLKSEPSYTGKCKIRIRGKSSSKFIKKGFKLTLTDENKRNIPLLGMPKEHEWALHGPFKDISLFRNKLAYDVGRAMGQCAPRAEFCELIIGNEYLGLYLLTETIKADKNRIAIKKNKNTSDTLKSFIVKIDHGGELLYTSKYKSEIDSGWGLYYKTVYPELERLSAFNKGLLINDIKDFEESVFDESNNWRQKIDLASFVDFILLNELTKNIDAYRLSSYMYKNMGEKLNMGPVWDFNYSLGLTNYNEGFNPEGWVLNGEAIPFWWSKLLEKKEFKEVLVERWFELRNDILTLDNLHKRINNYVLAIDGAKRRNFDRWYVYNNTLTVRQIAVSNYDQEVGYIKQWLQQRIEWIDVNIKLL